MSKALALLVIGGLGVGAVVLIASTSKASPKGPPAPAFGNGTTVQGKSGLPWLVARMLNPGPVASGVSVFGVFVVATVLNNAGQQVEANSLVSSPVLLFAQRGDDRSSRVFVSTPAKANAQINQDFLDDLAAKARQDFGV